MMRIHVYMYVYVCIHVYVYIYTYVCVSYDGAICMCIMYILHSRCYSHDVSQATSMRGDAK